MRYSNCSEVHFVHDTGSDEDYEVGYQTDHIPLKVDINDYPYTVYHLTFASLGPSILNLLDVSSRNYLPGVHNPGGIQVRSTPFSTNLISANNHIAVPESDKLPLPVLNWQF